MNNQHVLFYSNNCPHSREFIQLINNSQFNYVFKRYCIEEMRKIPNGIFEVPTIIVPGINWPLSGDNVFKWFQQNTQQNPMPQSHVMSNTPPRTNTNTNTNIGKEPFTQSSREDENMKPNKRPNFAAPPSLGDPIEEPSAFGIEMNSGFSDIYSWIEEGSEGKPMSHTFEYLNDHSSIQSTNTTTSNTNSLPQLPGTMQKTRAESKGDILNKKLEEFMNSRNNDPACNTSQRSSF
tara:strand:- start:2859 stop:3563 length:705 start_codon:yes stop_codon:yes gene_type:complete